MKCQLNILNVCKLVNKLKPLLFPNLVFHNAHLSTAKKKPYKFFYMMQAFQNPKIVFNFVFYCSFIFWFVHMCISLFSPARCIHNSMEKEVFLKCLCLKAKKVIYMYLHRVKFILTSFSHLLNTVFKFIL